MGSTPDGPAPSPSASIERVRALLDVVSDVRDTDPVRARELALDARVQARAVADPAGEAEALYQLANLAHGAGDPETAYALAAEAVDLAARAADPAVEAWADHLLGIVHYQAGNHVEALHHCRRSLELHHLSRTGVDEGNILNTIAAIHHSAGDHERAIGTYEAALAVVEPLGRPGFDAIVSGNLARIHAERGDLDEAVALGERAVALARVHRPDVVSNLLADLAEVYAELPDRARAVDCLGEARRLLPGSASPNDLGILLSDARVARRLDAPDRAVEVLTSAVELAVGAGSLEFEVEALDLLAHTLKDAGRVADALETRERHHDRAAELSRRSTELRLRTLRLAHETERARQRAEIFRLRGAERPTELPPMVSAGGAPSVSPLSDDPSAVQLDAFERLAILAEFRDVDTGQHTKRVGDLAGEIAHAAGHAPEWCERLRLAARLHDIGKVAVPDAVLLKSGPLTVEEFELMKTHTIVGHQILAGSASPLFQLAAEIALTHHEWWDGNGYPHARAGAEIPLSGRIVALADVFDALCSRRAYKRAWPLAEAARFVVSGRGAQFDPELISAFVSVMVAQHPELEAELS